MHCLFAKLRKLGSPVEVIERVRQVGPGKQGQSGLGLKAQPTRVRAFTPAQEWTLLAEFSDAASGKNDHRPGFQASLTRCRQLGAVLAAARLDRITRHAVATARGWLFGPTGRHARRQRPHDAGPRHHGPEKARADQRTYTSGAVDGQGAWGSARKSQLSVPPEAAAAAARPSERTKHRHGNGRELHRAAGNNFHINQSAALL